MGTYLLAIGIILIIMLGWVAVQHMARLFAARHPEFGPYPEGAGRCCGCGGSENCSRGTDVEESINCTEENREVD
jgi:hypothetical protein